MSLPLDLCILIIHSHFVACQFIFLMVSFDDQTFFNFNDAQFCDFFSIKKNYSYSDITKLFSTALFCLTFLAFLWD